MKKILLIFLLLSCKGHQLFNKKPPIGENEMVDIIVDISINYSYIILNDLKKPNEILEYKVRIQKDVLEKHQVSVEEFEASYMYYSQDMENLNKIYNKALVKADSIELYYQNNN